MKPVLPVLSDDFKVHLFYRVSCPVHLIKGIIDLFGGFWSHIMTVIHPHQFIFGVSKDFRQCIIKEGKVTRKISLKVCLFNVLKDGLLFLLTLFQNLLGPLALRNIV